MLKHLSWRPFIGQHCTDSLFIFNFNVDTCPNLLSRHLDKGLKLCMMMSSVTYDLVAIPAYLLHIDRLTDILIHRASPSLT